MADVRYRLFLDECGSPKPNGKDEGAPHFALGGILVRSQDILPIRTAVRAFAAAWCLPAPLLRRGCRAAGAEIESTAGTATPQSFMELPRRVTWIGRARTAGEVRENEPPSGE
jgi:hypothetical protein